MKAIVIYNSQTGFTKKYAEWIAERIAAECIEYREAKKRGFEDYDAIIFGGWAVGGSISKIDWFKENIIKWQNKKLVAFCVGASPADNPEIDEVLPKNFTEEELKYVKVFYCPGGLNYENMPLSSKTMMRIYVRMLDMNKNKTEKDIEQIRMMSSSYDISDIRYIEPIIDHLRK